LAASHPVQVNRSLQRALSAGLLELSDVQTVRRIRTPLDGREIGAQAVIGLGQRLAQRVQQVPEVGASLALGGIGPQGKGEVLARLGRRAVEEQVSQ
jgi:hypothetical protein